MELEHSFRAVFPKNIVLNVVCRTFNDPHPYTLSITFAGCLISLLNNVKHGIQLLGFDQVYNSSTVDICSSHRMLHADQVVVLTIEEHDSRTRSPSDNLGD